MRIAIVVMILSSSAARADDLIARRWEKPRLAQPIASFTPTCPRVAALSASFEDGTRTQQLARARALTSAKGRCRDEADRLVGSMATVWLAELPMSEEEPAQIAAALEIAIELATTAPRRALLTRDRALLAWEIATYASGRDAARWWQAARWADAAAALDRDDRDLARRAADARHNARISEHM